MRTIPNRRKTSSGEPWKKEWNSGRVRIQDPDGVASAIRKSVEKRLLLDPMAEDLVEHLGRGAKTELLQDVAGRTGVSRPTLHRLMHGVQKATSWRTLSRIEKWLRSEEEWRKILRCVLEPAEYRKRREYLAYVDRELERVQVMRHEKHTFFLSGPLQEAAADFRDFVRNRGLPATRAELGIYRAVDPLVGWGKFRRALSQERKHALLKEALRRERGLVKEEARILFWSNG